MVDQPKFERHIVLFRPRGEGVTTVKNVSIKICPNWEKGGRVNSIETMSLNLHVFFLMASLLIIHQKILGKYVNDTIKVN